jgi:hypothetical protein
LDVTATEISYTTSLSNVDVTASSDVIASTALPTTLVTTVTQTRVAAPPTPTAFIIQASRSGTSYDGQCIYLPQGGNPFFQFTSDITTATLFDTTSAPKFGGGTFPNTSRVASSVPGFAGLSAGGGNVNLATEQIYFYGPPNGLWIRVWFTNKLRRVPTAMHVCWAIVVFWNDVLSNAEELFWGSRVSKHISSAGFMPITSNAVGYPYYPVTLTAIPLY